MSEFNKSLYALNKYSENIVYRFGNEIREITLEDYLKENPTHTKQDFINLKGISDEIFYKEDLVDTSYRKKKLSIHSLKSDELTTEENIIEKIAKQENEKKVIKATYNLLEKGNLTEIQKRRFIMHFYKNMNFRQIAKKEGVSHIAIYN